MNLPNKLTVVRIVMIPLFLLLMCLPEQLLGVTIIGTRQIPVAWLWAMLVFTIASFTDFLDGYLARKYQLVTNFGKFADPIADKLLVMTAFICLVSVQRVPMWVASIIVCRELAVTGLRVLLVQSGEVLAAAWPGKIKTATQMVAIILLLVGDYPFQGLPFSMGNLFLYICLSFTIYSGIDYFVKNKQVFGDSF